MSAICSIKGVRSVFIVSVRRLKKAALLAGIATVFALNVGIINQAAAFESTRASAFVLNGIGQEDDNKTSLLPAPSRTTADACLPLLNVRPSLSAVETNRRPAGQKVATVGFVLGLRIALGPKELTGPDRVKIGTDLFADTGSGTSQALAVADYRRCKNDQALKVLNEKMRQE